MYISDSFDRSEHNRSTVLRESTLSEADCSSTKGGHVIAFRTRVKTQMGIVVGLWRVEPSHATVKFNH